MLIEKKIKRKIVKSIRKSLKTPTELVKSIKYFDESLVLLIISEMILNGELIPDDNFKLDLWRPR